MRVQGVGGMGMHPLWLGVTALGLRVLFVILAGRYPRPVQWMGRAVVHLVIGAFLLFFVNLMGTYVDLYLPFNLITLSIAGFLGVPGVLGLICIQWMIF